MTANLTVPPRSVRLTVLPRDVRYDPNLIQLEDSTGYWLFEDGSRIAWSLGGTPMQVPNRYLLLTLQERSCTLTAPPRSLRLTVE